MHVLARASGQYIGIIPQMPQKKIVISDMPLSVTQVDTTCHWDIDGIYEIIEIAMASEGLPLVYMEMVGQKLGSI
jgi:hypothetical protein